MKTQKEKAPYSVWQVYQRIYSEMWKMDKVLIFCGIAEILLNVAAPLLLTILPAAVIGMLEQGIRPAQYAWRLLLIFVPAAGICGLQTYLSNINRTRYTKQRMKAYAQNINMRTITMDYALSEQEATRVKRQNAEEAISSNSTGVEAFMQLNVQLAVNILGLIVYMCIISSIHPLIVLLLLVLSAVQMLTYRHARRSNGVTAPSEEKTQRLVSISTSRFTTWPPERISGFTGCMNGLGKYTVVKIQKLKT